MNRVRISIIIPVYNCEEYLEECLESVIRQTINDLEIICVDDGSTDGSHEILQKYAKKYDYVHVFTQKNSGAGIARNLGFSKAQGEFIAFLDADDFYGERDALEKMYCKCKEYSISVCGSRSIIKKGSFEKDAGFYKTNTLREDVIYDYVDFQMDYGYTSFIFKREIIEKNRIEFPTYRRFQDPPFLVKVLYYAQEFVYADVNLYVYRAPRVASRYSQDKVLNLLDGLRDNIIFAVEHDLEVLFEKTLRRLEYDYLYIILNNIFMDKDKNSQIFLKLVELNQIVQRKLNDGSYLIRTLKYLLNNNAVCLENYEAYLNDRLEKSEVISIYGAGEYAGYFLEYLSVKNYLDKVENIIVTSKRNNDKKIHDIEILDIEGYKSTAQESDIYVAVNASYHKEIIEILENSGIKKYILVDDVFLSRIG